MISVLLIFIVRISDDHGSLYCRMSTDDDLPGRDHPCADGDPSPDAVPVTGRSCWRQWKVNLLFFGSYDELELDEYHADMETLMADEDLLYRSLTRDIYFQAVILGKKYRFLRMAYHVFMAGLAISVLSFIVIAFR